MLTRARLALTIWGEPIVGRILMVLLRSSGYEAEFLSALSSTEPFSLEGSQLLVLTPTPQSSTEKREALLASLRKTSRSTNVPVLELVTLSNESREGRTRDDLWYMVPWPCGIEELEQRIEEALSLHHGPNAQQRLLIGAPYHRGAAG